MDSKELIEEKNKKSILFVCLCNICRSPIAQACFQEFLKSTLKSKKDSDSDSSSWVVDSAGLLNIHLGEQPDPRALKILRLNGINNFQHESRLVTMEDFDQFYWILTMDRDLKRWLTQMAPSNFKGQIELLGKYSDSNEQDNAVSDPYFLQGDKGYIKTYDQCSRYCQNFLDTFYRDN